MKKIIIVIALAASFNVNAQTSPEDHGRLIQSFKYCGEYVGGIDRYKANAMFSKGDGMLTVAKVQITDQRIVERVIKGMNWTTREMNGYTNQQNVNVCNQMYAKFF